MIKKKAINISSVFGTILTLIFFVLAGFFSFQHFANRDLALQWTQDIPDRINCHTVSYSGEFVAIGTDTGFCSVFDKNGKKVLEKKFSFPVLSLQFSYNSKFLYVKGYHLYTIDLLQQKSNWEKTKKVDVSWEKFKKGYVIEDFWVFRDSRVSVLFRAEKDITLVYLYLDQKGQTLKESVLPDIFGRYSCNPSVDGKYLLLSLLDGDMYLFQADGVVVWNLHLDPPVKEGLLEYPILQAIMKSGNVCISYLAEEYGKDLFITQLIDTKTNTVWKKNHPTAITGLMISPDEEKILITTKNKFDVFTLSGTLLYSLDQYGYKPDVTRLNATNVLVGFNSSETSGESQRKTLVYKLISLHQKRVLWQKRTENDMFDFTSVKNGYVFVEVSLHRVKLYRYVLTK
jgi:hypothetical protein